MFVMNMWYELTGDYDVPPSHSTGYGPTADRIDLKDVQAVRARFPRLAEFAGMSAPERGTP
jgi:hypothetical protein